MMDRVSRLLSPAIEYRDPDPERARIARSMLDAYLAELSMPPAPGSVPLVFGATPTAFASGRAILDSEPELQIACIRVTLDWALQRLAHATRRDRFFRGNSAFEALSKVWLITGLMSQLQRRRQPYSTADIIWILRSLVTSGVTWELLQAGNIGIQSLLRRIQRACDGSDVPLDIRTLLERFRGNIADAETTSDGRKALALIDSMLGRDEADEQLLDPSDDWGQLASEALAAMPEGERAGWIAMLRFAAAATGSKPSKKWIQEARSQVDRLGSEAFIATTINWLRLLDVPTRNQLYRRPDGYSVPSNLIAEANADVLKGLIWTCSVVEDDRIVRAVGDAGLACYRKIPNVGARSTKAGNACIWTLGALPGMSGVAELQRLTQKIKLPLARKQIEAALANAATRNGLTRSDLDDLAVPDFGLESGIIRRGVGAFTAEIAVERIDSVSLDWRRADGRAQSSVPADVKREFPAELKEMQQTLKDLRAALPAQRMRLEQLLLAGRSWPLNRWRERYLDHPLLSLIARRLIWTFERDGRSALGAWRDGQIVDAGDAELDLLDAETTVRLWHPIGSDVDTILAWRRWLERHALTQPFKQAHREVYILTDAERETATYSNRFAAHILRQHQLSALCQQRGWQYRLQGGWDGANVPQLDLPDWDLQVEFWVEAPDGPEAAMSGHGIYLYVATDQVRFTRRGGWEPMPLEEIPSLVFSEAMRDIDLFVGVCSVGADPNWLDGGADGRQVAWNTYWWEFAFGELSATAATRRVVLERLLPRLSINDRCRLDGRFLVVRGDLRTYRIHLGSGNILMEPNDQYLCIVPGRSLSEIGSDQLFLPFDGDATLSVILSKAFLLAADRSIKDPTIVRQIN